MRLNERIVRSYGIELDRKSHNLIEISLCVQYDEKYYVSLNLFTKWSDCSCLAFGKYIKARLGSYLRKTILLKLLRIKKCSACSVVY